MDRARRCAESRSRASGPKGQKRERRRLLDLSMLWNSISLSVARIARNTSMIDTLKLAKRLQQANLTAEQSEAIAEALAEANYLTKSQLEAVAEFRIEFRAELAKLKNELVYWLVGSVGLSVLINHF
jgi:hypothetical protein